MSKLAHTDDATMFTIELERLGIVTGYPYPPIGIRSMDWCAYYEGQEEAGEYGWGETERQAVDDLIENFPPNEGASRDH